eukprot:14165766-Ditylum_brightwellii.AAC.1
MSILGAMIVTWKTNGFEYKFIDCVFKGYTGQDNIQESRGSEKPIISKWIYTEAQTGRGRLDTHFSYLNLVLKAYIEDGNDMVLEEHILSAIAFRGGVTGTTVTAPETITDNKPQRHKKNVLDATVGKTFVSEKPPLFVKYPESAGLNNRSIDTAQMSSKTRNIHSALLDSGVQYSKTSVPSTPVEKVVVPMAMSLRWAAYP